MFPPKFYDNSILSGTKIKGCTGLSSGLFYDNSILSGTKMKMNTLGLLLSFTITQFFQVLKSRLTPNFSPNCFTITQFFQVLKLISRVSTPPLGFTITQFFQVLKYQIDNFLDISALSTITPHDYITSFSIKKAFSKEFKPLSTDVLMQSVSWSNFKSTLLFK